MKRRRATDDADVVSDRDELVYKEDGLARLVRQRPVNRMNLFGVYMRKINPACRDNFVPFDGC